MSSSILKLKPEFGPGCFYYKPEITGLYGLLVNNTYIHNLTAYGTPSLTATKFGRSLSVNRTDNDFVQDTSNQPFYTITGDLTIIVRAKQTAYAFADSYTFAGCVISGESLATNIPWVFGKGSSSNQLRVFWEDAGSSNHNIIAAENMDTTVGEYHTYACVRNTGSKTVTFLQNGKQHGNPTTYSADAAGGTSTLLALGATQNSTSEVSEHDITDVIVTPNALPIPLVRALTINIDEAYQKPRPFIFPPAVVVGGGFQVAWATRQSRIIGAGVR